MANSLENNSKSIERVGKRKWGYSVEQVDTFLANARSQFSGDGEQLTQGDIQNVSFDLARGGYAIAQVDNALARLECAVVDQQTEQELARDGREAWKANTESLYRTILAHVERDERSRFADGEAKKPSYDKKQVDVLIDKVIDKAAAGLGVDGVTQDDVRKLANLTSSSVAAAVFTQRKGKKGYDERQVDNFLNSCVQLLARIESYDRITKRLDNDEVDDQVSDQNDDQASETAAVASTAAVAASQTPVIADQTALIDQAQVTDGQSAQTEDAAETETTELAADAPAEDATQSDEPSFSLSDAPSVLRPLSVPDLPSLPDMPGVLSAKAEQTEEAAAEEVEEDLEQADTAVESAKTQADQAVVDAPAEDATVVTDAPAEAEANVEEQMDMPACDAPSVAQAEGAAGDDVVDNLEQTDTTVEAAETQAADDVAEVANDAAQVVDNTKPAVHDTEVAAENFIGKMPTFDNDGLSEIDTPFIFPTFSKDDNEEQGSMEVPDLLFPKITKNED